MRVNVLEKRWPAAVESSAWFIACEAITNVVKHAGASVVSLEAADEGGMLVLSIDDDGIGGADALGHGVRGMADRVETAGGQFSVAGALSAALPSGRCSRASHNRR
jgi:signal transduction histidine kinase